MQPKISVIMGIYNCDETLSEAIESIFAQTYKNWELIMCDDGSSDNTYVIAKKYAAEYPTKIILIQNEKNLKLAASLNKCLGVATGDYIARMDADDVSLPNRFEKQVNFLDMHPEIDCVGTCVEVFDRNGSSAVRHFNEFPEKTCLIHNTPFAHPTIMMRRKTYAELGGYVSSPETLRAEDVDLWFRFFAHNCKGYVIQEPLYKYREGAEDFEKRTLKAGIGATKVCLKGYKELHYPWYSYVYAFKPIVVALVPKRVMHLYHASKDKRNG